MFGSVLLSKQFSVKNTTIFATVQKYEVLFQYFRQQYRLVVHQSLTSQKCKSLYRFSPLKIPSRREAGWDDGFFEGNKRRRGGAPRSPPNYY